MNFFTNLIDVAVLLVGGAMIAAGALAFSDFIAFLLYVNIFMKPVFRLTLLTEAYQRGMAGFRRFSEVMETKPTVTDDPCALPAAISRGEIRFEDVSFGYEAARPILKHLNFTAEAGKTTAFVGETGAGKSTLISLLLRFYDPTDGRILIDGTDLRRLKQDDLRRHIGLVQQDVFLFSDSVADNIAYGKEGATDEEIREAAKMAAAETFIEALPQGFATPVGERGVKLSGGQKQRIAIARVILKNPTVVILDEATSALDTETEEQVRKTLETVGQNRTTILVAHRLSTVRNADRIIVLDQGRIIEDGNHESLLAKKGKYWSLCEAQKREKEE